MTIPALTDDELDERLKRLFAVHQGKERALPRWDLVTSVYGEGADDPQTDDNAYDRQIRRSVERLRTHGWLILDLGNGHGRYLAASEAEYREFRSYYLMPLRTRAAVIKDMDRAALEKWPNALQPALFDMDQLTVKEGW